MTAPPPGTAPRPLAGLRVVEVAQNLAGPFCARILGDMGADVVKVEPPTGDAARAWGPPFHHGVGTIFAFANTGKRSLVLDLKTEEGQAVLRRLVEGADVLVDALRPGTLAGMGLDWDTLHALNPRLVQATVLAYGEEGPLASLPGYEPLMQAHGGIMAGTGSQGGEPVRVGTSVVDMGTGTWAALGVLASLRERDRTGKGGRVSGALFDTAVTLSGYHLVGAADDGTVPERMGTELPMICPYGAFPVQDGRIMVAVGTDALFRRLCHSLELGPLDRDPRFRDNPARVANRETLNPLVSEATAAFTAAALLERLRAGGVPCAPIMDVGELLGDAQFQASGMLAPASPSGGTDRSSGLGVPLPLRWNGVRLPLGGAVPELGEHTDGILADLGPDDGTPSPPASSPGDGTGN